MKSRCNNSKMKPRTLPARQRIVISCCSLLSMPPPTWVEKELGRGIKKIKISQHWSECCQMWVYAWLWHYSLQPLLGSRERLRAELGTAALEASNLPTRFFCNLFKKSWLFSVSKFFFGSLLKFSSPALGFHLWQTGACRLSRDPYGVPHPLTLCEILLLQESSSGSPRSF